MSKLAKEPRYGRRPISTMLANWDSLRRACAESGNQDVQDAFDACEEWVGFSLGAASTATTTIEVQND